MLALSITVPEINSPSVFEAWIKDWRWYCILLLDPCPSDMEAHSWAQEQLLLIAGAKAEQRKAARRAVPDVGTDIHPTWAGRRFISVLSSQGWACTGTAKALHDPSCQAREIKSCTRCAGRSVSRRFAQKLLSLPSVATHQPSSPGGGLPAQHCPPYPRWTPGSAHGSGSVWPLQWHVQLSCRLA